MDQFQIDNQQILDFIKQGLHEDVQDGDHTSLACIPAHSRTKARLLVKDHGIIAGVALAEMIFKFVDPECSMEVFIKDGGHVNFGDVAFVVEGNSQALLKAERLVLNSMQRMSGIATMTDRFVTEVEGLPVKLLDTRKTTPLIRFLEKWAVKIGGGNNYRHGLYDWIMIKDNHIDACGSIPAAINRVNDYLKEKNLNLGITIEVRNLEELHQVLEVGNVTRIMLDNFDIPLQKEAVQIVAGRFETEASGGVNIQTVGAHAKTGVDYISIGALTHSPQSLDMSLKVMK